MALQANDLIRAAVAIGAGDQTIGYNVFHWILTAEDPANDDVILTALANKLADMYTYLSSYVSSLRDILRVEFYVENRNYALPIRYVTFAATGSGEPLPSGVSLLLRFHTGVRRVVGKKYLFGFTEAHVNGDTWSTALCNAAMQLGVAYNTTISYGTAGVIQPGILSRAASGIVAIKEINASNVVAYQRRRRPPHLP